jgi:hypothetical protein
MSTYLELQDRVNIDYLNRTGFTAATKRAILASIRHYERVRWNFNETSTALTTSSGQSFVTFPSNFLVLDDLRITINSEDLPLKRRDPQWIRDANMGSTANQPTDFAIYQNRAELFAVPNSAYSVPIYYVKSLTALSADTDTNAWTTGIMEDLIVYSAAKLMWANVLRNDTEAAKFAALEQGAFNEAIRHHEQFKFHGLKATKF